MSEDRDKSQQTEEATDRRIEDAKKKGNVARSREVGNFVVVFSILILLWTVIPQAISMFIRVMLPFMETPEDIPLELPADFFHLSSYIVNGVVLSAVAAATLLFVGGLASAFLQGPVVVSPDRIMPKLEKISVMRGIKRIFSASGMMEFLKGILKIGVVMGITIAILIPHYFNAERLVGLPAESIMGRVVFSITALLGVLCIFAGVLALFDKVWQQSQWKKNLRMTKQEVKEELKGSDGDPKMKAKQKEVGRARIAKPIAKQVPKATVVLTNPTHYSVALRYNRGVDEAPVCVAKGTDEVALKIREIAKQHAVPIYENPPLTRALYATVELDQPIPIEHYKAVAEIISFVLGLTKKDDSSAQ